MAENKDVELGDAKITIQDTVKNLVAKCKENQKQGDFTISIYRAPSAARKLNHNSFNPGVVSIGPLHHADFSTREFETQKVKFVNDLLKRLNIPLEQTLEECADKVASKIKEIKGCYDDIKSYEIKIFTDAQLVKMMIMDACFILGFIYQLRSESDNPVDKLRARSICYDLVLLENQIPFFVLEDMYNCTILKSDKCFNSLVEFIFPVLMHVNLFHTNLRASHEINKTDNQPICHIVSLLHMYYQPDQPQSNALSFYSCSRSAVELDRAGVIFKPNKDEKRPMEVKVRVCRYPWPWGKPAIIMPVMRLDNFTESVLRNLIAYEISSTKHHYVTSFGTTMDMLIDTEDDVALLVQSEVLVNKMGSNQEAAKIMNNICKVSWAHIDKSWEELDIYCKRYWPKTIEGFKRTYFSSPWSTIALVAGILLFTLTIIQTFFAINPPGIKE